MYGHSIYDRDRPVSVKTKHKLFFMLFSFLLAMFLCAWYRENIVRSLLPIDSPENEHVG